MASSVTAMTFFSDITDTFLRKSGVIRALSFLYAGMAFGMAELTDESCRESCRVDNRCFLIYIYISKQMFFE